MKIGICTSKDYFEIAKKAGFEYAEPSIQPFLSSSKNDNLEVLNKLKNIDFSIDGFNNFFSSSISLYNDSIETIIDYAKRNFEISKMYGCEYSVIGSGKSRSIPTDLDKEKAENRFLTLIDKIADIGKTYSIKLYIEPLNFNETNYINTLKDGIEFKRKLNNDNVGCLVDFFHFYKNEEDLSSFDLLKKEELTHVHLARPNPDRDAPITSDIDVLKQWANVLNKIGYTGRISLECLWKNGVENSIDEAYTCMQVFK